ncbi:MinD/ParA family protein [Salsuginibacillus kocurii]|uniref:MinD/ParA family protein n=1 Tax=Salsuginibacillus kocurii TaxID=427078 RepID=UPI0003796B73|nr:MinD/ParA family protein [Salsuginibacillus kocurii]
MSDQARNLRKRMEARQAKTVEEMKIVTVVSGKGGVGKSNVSVNFSVALSQAGQRVLLLDLDVGMANIDILLGKSSPYSIVDMIDSEFSIWDIMNEGPYGLKFIAGGSGLTNLFEMNEQKRERFLTQLESLKGHIDTIVLDMGAGATHDSMHFIMAAHEALLVTTPEPTSITDAYSMIKYLHLEDKDLPISLIVNRVQSPHEGKQTGENLSRVTAQFLQKELRVLSTIPDDSSVLTAVRRQVPVLINQPKAKASRAIQHLAETFSGEEAVNPSSTFTAFATRFRRFFGKEEG